MRKPMRKKYRVPKDVLEHLQMVLDSSYEAYRVEDCDESHVFIRTDIPTDRFHKLALRARCELETEKSGRFHLTYAEAMNPRTMKAILDRAGETAFVIAGWDQLDDKKKAKFYRWE